MLSDTKKFETSLDQEFLKAQVLSVISGRYREQKNIIGTDEYYQTEAGIEHEYLTDLGLDVDILEERESEFGSKALLFSYTDKLLILVEYNDYIDRYTYKALSRDNVDTILEEYYND